MDDSLRRQWRVTVEEIPGEWLPTVVTLDEQHAREWLAYRRSEGATARLEFRDWPEDPPWEVVAA